MLLKLNFQLCLIVTHVFSDIDFDFDTDNVFASQDLDTGDIGLHSNPRFAIPNNFHNNFEDIHTDHHETVISRSFPLNAVPNGGGGGGYFYASNSRPGSIVVASSNTPTQHIQGVGPDFSKFLPNIPRGANYFARPSFLNHHPVTENSVSGICGHSIYELITGGDKVQPGEYPWLASLFEDSSYICTASLVTSTHLLTAAHCVHGYVDPFLYSIVLGVTTPRQDNLRYISKIQIHPDYVKSYAAHDVAILSLYTAVSFSNTIKPICLWYAHMSTGESNGVVAGFGPDYTQCRKIRYPIVSQSTCVDSNRHFRSLVSDNTFCAGTRNGEGPCLGDSGSGFMQFLGGRFYLRGIVSQSLNANNDCNLREYILFSDLATETSWLHRELDQYIN